MARVQQYSSVNMQQRRHILSLVITLLISIKTNSQESTSKVVEPPKKINGTQPMVNIYMRIVSIVQFGNNELLTISGWGTLTWKDSRYKRNVAKDYYMAQDAVWLPDVGFWNAIQSDEVDIRRKTLVNVRVSPDGTVVASFQFRPSIPCVIKEKHFPFDSQLCDIRFGQVISRSRDYNITLEEIRHKFSEVRAIGEWQLISQTVYNSYDKLPGYREKRGYCGIKLLLHRKQAYYLTLIIIPFIIVSFLGVLIFLVDDKSDRVSVGVSLIATQTIYVLIASQSSPKSVVTISMLSLYLLCQMVCLTIFIFLSVITILKCKTPVQRKRVDIALLIFYKLFTIGGLFFFLIWANRHYHYYDEVEKN